MLPPEFLLWLSRLKEYYRIIASISTQQSQAKIPEDWEHFWIRL
ncbi:hypothetical protein LEMLEM_LOCUS6469 [Lemmus lemmus]